MSISIDNFVNVKERAAELDCNIPHTLAILPRNFSTAKLKTDLLHESSAPAVRVLLRQTEIVEIKLEKSGEKFNAVTERGNEWIAPIIFLGASLLNENPHATSILINILSNYLTDLFKGIPGNNKVCFDIVVERHEDEEFVKIHYEGNVEGLSGVPEVVSEVYVSES